MGPFQRLISGMVGLKDGPVVAGHQAPRRLPGPGQPQNLGGRVEGGVPQSQVGVHEQREPLELRPDERLLARHYEPDNADRVLATVLVEELPVPVVHLQVLV